MPTAASRFLAFTFMAFIALALSLGFGAPQALADQGSLTASGSELQDQTSKIYPSKKEAKKAVIAKVKAKWKKITAKAKVVEASKVKMTDEQKKVYKNYRKNAGKNVNKYRFYVVTIKNPPEFTVKAKYRGGNGKVKTYSLKAYANGTIKGATSDSCEWLIGYHSSTKGENCFLYAVLKGSGTHDLWWAFREGNVELTGTIVKMGTIGYSRKGLKSAEIHFKLKG